MQKKLKQVEAEVKDLSPDKRNVTLDALERLGVLKTFSAAGMLVPRFRSLRIYAHYARIK